MLSLVYPSLKLLPPLMPLILKPLYLCLRRLISGLTLSMLILLLIKAMMLRNFIIMLEIFSTVIALFLLTSVILKSPLTDDGYMVCEAGIKMLKDGKQYFDGFIKQKFVCKFCNSKDDSACPINHPKYLMAKSIEAVLSMLLYLLIIGPLLIETPYILRLSIN
ncbi:hypothetical protein TheetDRAFT_2847 [Thermoanaerobacter ethanolicus JW 200]|nr:hypothetical protein TheetDRAFT_2847 [Thermoanaerobacter ethanolicus JW 200]